MTMYKRLMTVALSMIAAAATILADVKVLTVEGSVKARRGMKEEWVRVAPGDVLKPEDSILLEKKSSTIVLIDGKEKLTVPGGVLLDLSDLRKLSREELLLKLAMQRVRSVPSGNPREDMQIPRTTAMHGEKKESRKADRSSSATADMELNGAKVLFENGFYATSVLKTKEIFRRAPETASRTGYRFMVAEALEKMNLNGEALDEYKGLAREKLSESEAAKVKEKLASLKPDR